MKKCYQNRMGTKMMWWGKKTNWLGTKISLTNGYENVTNQNEQLDGYETCKTQWWL